MQKRFQDGAAVSLRHALFAVHGIGAPVELPAGTRGTVQYTDPSGYPVVGFDMQWPGTDAAVRKACNPAALRLERCDGCDEAGRPLAWWDVWYRDGDTGRARFCASCGAAARDGEAENIISADPVHA